MKSSFSPDVFVYIYVYVCTYVVLIQHSVALNRASGKDTFGSSEFNLTLINRCFSSNDKIVHLKKEPMFEEDLAAVSWHADSCLDHFSTIAVYHWDEATSIKDQSHKKWRAALRVSINAEGPQQGKEVPDLNIEAPPLAVEMPKECVYYLLDEFNHHHQHTILAGDSNRFASTHRVSRTEGHTFSYIRQRCQSIIGEVSFYSL